MNREINFRGKTDSGDWIVGALAFFFNQKEMTYIMPNCYYGTRDFGEVNDNDEPIINETETALGGFIKVNPETVGQFTGLTDKNGKEIYEGDIVSNTKSLNKETGIVVFERGCFYLKVNEKTKYLIFWFSGEKGEVIGNIYENPEILHL